MGIARNSSAFLGFVSTTNTQTASYTVSSGSNRMLYVLVDGAAAGDFITGVTYAGVAMTLIGKGVRPTSARWVYAFYLLNPASGSNNVVVSASATCDLILTSAVDYTGVLGLLTSTTGSAAGSGTATGTVSCTSNNWLILGENSFNGGSPPPSSITGATRVVYDTSFGDSGVYDTNGPVGPGSESLSFANGTSGAFIILAAFSPFVPPGPVLGGAWKRSGLPTVKKNHFIRQKLLAFWVDTGMGFYWDAMGNFPPYPGPVNSGYAADAAIPYNQTLPTPYGAAQIWQGNSFPGFVQPGPCAIFDTTIVQFNPIVKANDLYNQGIGAGYSIVCGFMHTGEALQNVTTVGSPVSGWIFGRTNHAVEATPWMNCGFYKTFNDPTTIGCGVATGTSSSNWTPLTVGTFTSTPYEYTVCGLSCVNTSFGAGIGSGNAKFYAQGNLIATQSGFSFIGSDIGNDSEGQIQFGIVFHTSTGESQCPMDGSAYWGVFCKGALTAAEQAYFAWPGMLNDALDWGGGEDIVFSPSGAIYTPWDPWPLWSPILAQ